MNIWDKQNSNRKIRELKNNIETDILIVGGGLTGLNTAYFLKDRKACVVDANLIGHGVTLNSTAKINYLQDIIFSKVTKKNEYLNSQIYASNLLKQMINKEKIDCNFKEVKSFIFLSNKKEEEKFNEYIDLLKSNNVDIKEEKIPLSIPQYKSYSVDDTYIFNPIKYLNGLYNILIKNGIDIYENTKIIKIEKSKDNYIAHTSKYKIKAKIVILACHYPFFLIPMLLPLKSSIEKSYIIVSRVNKDLNFTCINVDNPIYSVRYYSDNKNIYQISLSESHCTAYSQNDKYHFDRVQKRFKIEDKDIVMKYSNVDILTPDYMPFIGKLKNNMYIGCGYNTWGMTNSILAANIISDLIMGKQNKYESLFNPNRFSFSNFIKLPYILFSQTKSYLGPKIIKNKSWYKKNIEFKNNIAIYKDKNGFKHKVINKCPHMGCSLVFNENELTWDCPCHSSRFDMDGKCIKGPSTYDITYKE